MAGVKIRGTILAADENNYTDKKTGEPRSYPTVTLRVDGKIVRLPRNKQVTVGDSLVDKSVDIECELSTFGDSMEPTLRIVSVGK